MIKHKKILLKTMRWFFCVTIILVGTASFAWCAQSDYDGTYAGTYAHGEDNGYWVAIADESADEYKFILISYSPENDTGDVGLAFGFSGETGGIARYDGLTGQGIPITIFLDSTDDYSAAGIRGDDNGTLEGAKLTSSEYAGHYLGTYTGDDTGGWWTIIAPVGTLSSAMVSDNEANGLLEGGCHPDGYALAVGVIQSDEDEGETMIAAFIKISGTKVSGSWIAPEVPAEGTLSGTKQVASKTKEISGDGGSGSGCFILNLIGR